MPEPQRTIRKICEEIAQLKRKMKLNPLQREACDAQISELREEMRLICAEKACQPGKLNV